MLRGENSGSSSDIKTSSEPNDRWLTCTTTRYVCVIYSVSSFIDKNPGVLSDTAVTAPSWNNRPGALLTRHVSSPSTTESLCAHTLINDLQCVWMIGTLAENIPVDGKEHLWWGRSTRTCHRASDYLQEPVYADGLFRTHTCTEAGFTLHFFVTVFACCGPRVITQHRNSHGEFVCV